MSDEPDSLILRLLRDMRADLGDMRAELGDMRSEMATKIDLADLRAEMQSLRADVAADLLALEARQEAQHKLTREQIVGLRRAVVEYHTSVIGHGLIISDLEARLRRVEQHLNLSGSDVG